MKSNELMGTEHRSVDERRRVMLPQRNLALLLGDNRALTVTLQSEKHKDDEIKFIGIYAKNAPEAVVCTGGATTYSAVEIEVSAQGRIYLPQCFYAEIGLPGHVAIVGVRNRMEIWNPKEWELYYEESIRKF